MEKPTQDTQKPQKADSLSKLRDEIETLEEKITETKRRELILAEEREDMKIIYEWKAPERAFRPKNRKWYINSYAISLIVIILSVLTKNYILILAVFAIQFLLYAMNTVPPRIFDYQISNKGLRIGTVLYMWNQLPAFWITTRGLDTFLNLEIKSSRSKRLMLLVGDGNIDIIAKEMVRYIDYLSPDEMPSDFISKITEGKHKPISDFYPSEAAARS